MKHITSTVLIIFLSVFEVFSQAIIPSKDAPKYIGKTSTITEKVFSGKTESGTIFLEMGGYGLKADFVVIIPAAAKNKFKGKPENDYKGKDITVTGKLINYKGKPAIEITEVSQIKIVLVDNAKGVPIKQRN